VEKTWRFSSDVLQTCIAHNTRHQSIFTEDWTSLPDDGSVENLEAAKTALDLDEMNAITHYVLGQVYKYWHGRLRRGRSSNLFSHKSLRSESFVKYAGW